MNIFDFYKDPAKHNELGEILTLGAHTYLSEVAELAALKLPTAEVQAYGIKYGS